MRRYSDVLMGPLCQKRPYASHRQRQALLESEFDHEIRAVDVQRQDVGDVLVDRGHTRGLLPFVHRPPHLAVRAGRHQLRAATRMGAGLDVRSTLVGQKTLLLLLEFDDEILAADVQRQDVGDVRAQFLDAGSMLPTFDEIENLVVRAGL